MEEIQSTTFKPRTWIFYFIQMFISFGQNLSYQFLPVYTRKTGANETQMGLLTSLGNIFSTLFSPFFGKQSDLHGRKAFIAGGTFIAFGAGIGIAVSNSVVMVLIAATISAIGTSIFVPAWSGAMADYTENKNRGGFIGRMMGVGSAFVTLMLVTYIIGIKYVNLNDIQEFKLIMYISAINFFIVSIVSFLFLDIKIVKRTKKPFTLFEPLKDKKFRRALYVILFWWLNMSFAWSYFPIIISDVLELTASQIAIIGIAQTLVQTITSYKGADLIDRLGAKKTVILGFIPFSMVPLFFALATEWWHLLLPQIIAGIGIGWGFAGLQVYILNLAGSEKAGTYQGVYNLSFGILTFFGSLAGGMVLQYYKSVVGLNKAVFNLLIIIAVMRFFTNFLMVAFLPDDKSSI